MSEPKGPSGFFVTVKRKGAGPNPDRVGWLLGPHDTLEAAKERLPLAIRLANRVDPRTHFDTFGVTFAEAHPGGSLPVAVLEQLAAEDDGTPDRIQAYTHTTP